MIIIIVLLLIIAVPTILDLAGLGYMVYWVSKLRYLIVVCFLAFATHYCYRKFPIWKWNHVVSKTENLITKTIRNEKKKNPLISSNDIFEELKKEWVPFIKKMYPNTPVKEIGLKLRVHPVGIDERMFEMGLKYS